MKVCVLCVLVVGLKLGMFVGYTLTENCPIQLSPDSLLVEYGDSAEVNCSLTPTFNKSDTLGWEASVGAVDKVPKSSVLWTVSSLTEWEVNRGSIMCYLNYNNGQNQCKKPLQLKLYKRPDSVMIDPGHDDWSEGEKRKLECKIKSVGPVSNLTVQWTRLDRNKTRTIIQMSRNFTIFGRKDENDEMGNVTDTLEVQTSPEVDGVQYQCVALLDLTQLKQPQVGSSQLFNTTVLYKPIITQPTAATVSRTTGDTLMLNCLARGNPEPQFTWTRGDLNITHSSLLHISSIQSEHQANYTCIASNSKGSASVTVMVTVSEDTLPIIASCAAVAVALLIVGLCVWYCMHYRHTHMGHYILRNLTSRRHNANVAHSDSQTLQSH